MTKKQLQAVKCQCGHTKYLHWHDASGDYMGGCCKCACSFYSPMVIRNQASRPAWSLVPLILASLAFGCESAPFTMAESVIMTDAGPESTSVGSEADSGQSELSVQLDGAVLPMGVDSGDASDANHLDSPETEARDSDVDSGVHETGPTEETGSYDASPDSNSGMCVASECPQCGSGYNPCCKATSCGCVSAVFPQGCY